MVMKNFLNKVICGNCIDILVNLPEKSVDLIVTSPPYGDMREYTGYTFDFYAVANELARVLKDGGVLVWVVADKVVKGSETLDSLRQAIYFKDKCGLLVNDTMIYQKRSYLPQSGKRYDQVWDYMFVFTKKHAPNTFNKLMVEKVCVYPRRVKNFHRSQDGSFKKGEYDNQATMKKRTNIWKYRNAGGQCSTDRIAHQHPAIFPEQLATDHILTWTNPGDIVLDPLGGSGTVARQSVVHGRNFIYIDESLEYCELTEKRLEKLNDKS